MTDTERNDTGLLISMNSGRFRDVLTVLDSASTDLGRDSVFGLLEDVPAWEMHFSSPTSGNFNSATFRVWERM